MRQMLALGEFIFSVSKNTPYTGLTRSSGGGWTTVSRYGQKPMLQNMGLPLEDISISGIWFFGDGMNHMDEIRAMQAKREPQVLTDGYGVNLGRWVIDNINETQDRIIDDGTACVVDFSIKLKEYVE